MGLRRHHSSTQNEHCFTKSMTGSLSESLVTMHRTVIAPVQYRVRNYITSLFTIKVLFCDNCIEFDLSMVSIDSQS